MTVQRQNLHAIRLHTLCPQCRTFRCLRFRNRRRIPAASSTKQRWPSRQHPLAWRPPARSGTSAAGWRRGLLRARRRSPAIPRFEARGEEFHPCDRPRTHRYPVFGIATHRESATRRRTRTRRSAGLPRPDGVAARHLRRRDPCRENRTVQKIRLCSAASDPLVDEVQQSFYAASKVCAKGG